MEFIADLLYVCNRSLDSIVNFPYTYCKISLHFYNYLILVTFSKPMLCLVWHSGC